MDYLKEEYSIEEKNLIVIEYLLSIADKTNSRVFVVPKKFNIKEDDIKGLIVHSIQSAKGLVVAEEPIEQQEIITFDALSLGLGCFISKKIYNKLKLDFELENIMKE